MNLADILSNLYKTGGGYAPVYFYNKTKDVIKIIKLFKKKYAKNTIYLKVYKDFTEKGLLKEDEYIVLNFSTGLKLHEKYIWKDIEEIPMHELLFNKTKSNILWKMYRKLNKEFEKREMKLYGQIFFYLTELLNDENFGKIIRELKKKFKYNDDQQFFKYVEIVKGLKKDEEEVL